MSPNRKGFELPMLEAMSCGAPVVGNNTSSLPEVAGDAALLADPLDVEALAETLGRVTHPGRTGASHAREGAGNVVANLKLIPQELRGR